MCIDASAIPPILTDEDVIASLTLGATFTITTGVPVTNAPIYVPIDRAHLDADLLRRDGGNLRFVNRDTGRLVPAEIVHFEPNGTTEVWLQLASINGPAHMQVGYGPDTLTANADTGWSASAFANVWHFDDGTDATGNAASFGTSLQSARGPLGNALATRETLTTTRQQTMSAMTLELLARPADASWTIRRTLRTDPTVVVNQQVMWTLPAAINGRDVRDADGNAISIWTERSSAGVAQVWARAPQAGTTQLTSYEGGNAPVPEAGIRGVCINGLWETRWNFAGNRTPNDTTGMNALFTGLSFATAASSTYRGTNIAFDSGFGCTTADGEAYCNFAILYEGWLVVPAGNRRFGTTSDDASDVLLGGAWKDGTGANVVVTAYGSHGTAQTTPASAPIPFDGTPMRSQYRVTQGNGNWGAYALASPTKTTLDKSTDAIPVTQFFTRTRVRPEPVTYQEEFLLGEVLHEANDLTVHVGPQGATVTVGSAVLNSGQVEDWRALAVVYAEGIASLYVDGALQDTQTVPFPPSSGARVLQIGDLTGDSESPAPAIDELRFSTVARTPEWLDVQARNLRGELVHFD